MAKNCVGIDIGACQIKLALCSDGEVRRLVVENMPDSLVRDGRIISMEATAEFLKEVASKEKVNIHSCGVILPSAVAFTRTMTLPTMSEEHLKLNLPYEFRDFITQEKDKYYYDYAVLDYLNGPSGEPEEFELIAAATLKETIKDYSDMCRRAGFKLITAVPEEVAYMNIIRGYEAKNQTLDSEKEYCLIDLGHTGTRLHIYKGFKHQATRVVDYGAQMLDTVIAEQMNVDEHIARAYKHANNNEELESEACRNVYSTISVEVMRAINFYRFNSPDSNLEEVYLCGGGARIQPLVHQIMTDLSNMSIRRIDDILPVSAGTNGDAVVCPAAIGVAMQ